MRWTSCRVCHRYRNSVAFCTGCVGVGTADGSGDGVGCGVGDGAGCGDGVGVIVGTGVLSGLAVGPAVPVCRLVGPVWTVVSALPAKRASQCELLLPIRPRTRNTVVSSEAIRAEAIDRTIRTAIHLTLVFNERPPVWKGDLILTKISEFNMNKG